MTHLGFKWPRMVSVFRCKDGRPASKVLRNVAAGQKIPRDQEEGQRVARVHVRSLTTREATSWG